MMIVEFIYHGVHLSRESYGVIHHARANHVQVNVHEAAMQVLIGFDGGSVIAIFPKRSLPFLALVIFLRGATRAQLNALGISHLGQYLSPRGERGYTSPHSRAPITRTASLPQRPSANNGVDRARILARNFF
jgi:hypothetical protein